MEKRVLLAFLLSFVVFVFWLKIFPPPMQAPVEGPRAEEEARGRETARRPHVPAEEEKRTKTIDPEKAWTNREALGEEDAGLANKVGAVVEKKIRVETPLYSVVFSNRGAAIESFKLQHYRDSEGRPFEVISERGREELNVRPLDLRLEEPEWTQSVQTALFESSSSGFRVDAERERTLTFRWSDGRGLEVEKILTFKGSSYQIGTFISVKHRGGELAKQVLFGPGVGNESTSSRYLYEEKGVVVAGGEVELFKANDIANQVSGVVGVGGGGVASHYFAALMVPTGDGVYTARFASQDLPAVGVENEPDWRPKRRFITATLDSPREATEFLLFVGPKTVELLDELGPGFQNIVELGWMRSLAIPLRSGLMAIYKVVGNYGWAIVVLTLIINVALAPLKHYSYVSMRKMQKLAPQVKRIQERFKKLKPTDPRRQEMNKEIMALYQEKKVSPLSGCFPMLLMIPFFFAFYRVLMAGIELRQAHFALWITDLSIKDPYYVLPIMMGASQLLMQKMTPQTSADPVQARVMAFMPVIFTFILATAPSGLVLYWFANNVVSMGQQTLTNRYLKEREAKEEAQIVAAKKKSKKSAKRPKDR